MILAIIIIIIITINMTIVIILVITITITIIITINMTIVIILVITTTVTNQLRPDEVSPEEMSDLTLPAAERIPRGSTTSLTFPSSHFRIVFSGPASGHSTRVPSCVVA